MTKRTKTTGLFLCICFILLSCALVPKETVSTVYEARVTAVVDGDTIKVQFVDAVPEGCSRSERVRFIGVNTPELTTNPPEYFALEARDFTNSHLYLQTVFLEFDTVSARKDRYGRLLCYVYKDDSAISINQQLLASGYAYYYGVFAFDAGRMTEFKTAEHYAQQNQLGLWEL